MRGFESSYDIADLPSSAPRSSGCRPVLSPSAAATTSGAGLAGVFMGQRNAGYYSLWKHLLAPFVAVLMVSEWADNPSISPQINWALTAHWNIQRVLRKRWRRISRSPSSDQYLNFHFVFGVSLVPELDGGGRRCAARRKNHCAVLARKPAEPPANRGG